MLAVELAYRSARSGNHPFGAVILRDSEVIATAENRVVSDADPTAHAEIVAVRIACQRYRTLSLEQCTIYASCQPCSMCSQVIRRCLIDSIHYSVPREVAVPYGFVDAHAPIPRQPS